MGLTDITIFNTDGLAKLGNTICYGIGLTARGYKKMAKAESYAAIKKAKTDIEVEILKRKGEEDVANYVLARETRKMNNTTSVVEKSTKHFAEGEKVSDEPVNPDWTNRLFSIVEDVSDDLLQEMWGKILADEVKHPKSYSLRTLDVLKNINREEAELFADTIKLYLANNFICTEERMLSLFQGLTLSDAGLINSESLVKNWEVEPNDKLVIYYKDNMYLNLYNNKNTKIHITISVKKLTQAGSEIMLLCEKSDNKEMLLFLSNFLKDKGVDRITHQIYNQDNTGAITIVQNEIEI